jgi:hypothetical protein
MGTRCTRMENWRDIWPRITGSDRRIRKGFEQKVTKVTKRARTEMRLFGVVTFFICWAGGLLIQRNKKIIRGYSG